MECRRCASRTLCVCFSTEQLTKPPARVPLPLPYVATASYRLHPLVVLNPSKPVPPEHAEKFARCFSPGVVKLGPHGTVSIEERSLRKETMSREVLRHKEFDGCVELKRVRDWFICASPLLPLLLPLASPLFPSLPFPPLRFVSFVFWLGGTRY